MNARKLDRLFDRFRRKGDVDALGEVFDLTAPELYRVAVHLSRNLHRAEDLVQATFLAAIQARDRYDAKRELLPWLLGILTREAALERRKLARSVEHERLHEHATVDPSAEAESTELAEHVDAAVDGIPSPYREVLIAHLRAGKSPLEIARELNRAPGTVRVQLHRGLDLLRKALPAGLVLQESANAGPQQTVAMRQAILGVAAREFSLATGTTSVVTTGALLSIKAWAAAICVAIGLGWYGFSTWQKALPELISPRLQWGGESNNKPSVALAPRVQPPVVPSGRDPIAQNSTDLLSAGDHAKCVVFGQVVDENDRPLSGVAVRLQGYQGWADGIDVPPLPGDEFPGWEIATDKDGAFRFQVPRPTVEMTRIKIQPDPFHDVVQIYFGGRSEGALPALDVGHHDLGVLRAASTGGFRGRVFDESNRGVAGLEVSIYSGRSKTKLDGWGTTDTNGAYSIGHVLGGAHTFEVKCDGHTVASRRIVEVTAGRFTDGIDFVMKTLPILRGVVVDEAGAALEGVELYGWPASAGKGAGTSSNRDGSFEVSLPQNEPYTLEATLAGYAPYDSNEHLVTYPPGTRGIRIELKRAVVWPLSVVDSDTGQPVERFGLDVRRNNSARAPHPVRSDSVMPPIQDFPGGVANVEMRMGMDVLLVLVEGRKEVRFDPELSQLENGRIVVRIAGGSTVTGRLMQGTVPAAGINLRLCSGWWSDDANPLAAGGTRGEFMLGNIESRAEKTDEKGFFRFEQLDRGDYRVLAPDKSGMAINTAPFKLDEPVLDLGELQLAPGATIIGQVTVPANRSRRGLTIHLDEQDGKQELTTDSEGRFRFEGLRAGYHNVVLEEVEGAITAPPSLELLLAAGEQRNVVLDASQCGTCQVKLTILFGSKPAAERDVVLVNPAIPSTARKPLREKEGRGSSLFWLGRTDEKGQVAGWAPAWGTARVVVYPSDDRQDLALEHATVSLDLMLDARIECTLAFEFGTLAIALPDGLALPEKSYVSVTLHAGSERRSIQELRAFVDPEQTARIFKFEGVLAGDAELQVELIDMAVQPRSEKNADGHTDWVVDPIYKATQSVKIISGGTTEVRFR